MPEHPCCISKWRGGGSTFLGACGWKLCFSELGFPVQSEDWEAELLEEPVAVEADPDAVALADAAGGDPVGGAGDIGAAVPVPDGVAEDHVWDDYVRQVVRVVEWGHFRFSMKRCSPQHQNGIVEAICPYHCRSARSGCKKAITIRERNAAHVDLLLRALKNWCNRAQSVTRQREHKWPVQLDLELTPPPATVLANRYTAPVPANVLTDAELDALDAEQQAHPPQEAERADDDRPAVAIGKAQPKGKAKAKQAGAPKAQAKRVAAPQAAALEPQGGGSSSSTSSSSDTSSSTSESE